MKEPANNVRRQFTDLKNKGLRNRLSTIDWEAEANDILKQITAYWQKISKSEKKAIGLFDIRWDDAATNQAVEFDFEENNNPDEIMAEGANKNEPVITFSALFKKLGVSTNGSEFEVTKEILCGFVCEIILASTLSEEFSAIKKKKKYYIAFSKFHDDDESEIIYDSTDGVPSSVKDGELDLKAFIKACKKEDVKTVLKQIPLVQKIAEAKERDKFLSAATDLYIDCWRSGDDLSAMQLIKEFVDIQKLFGPSTKKIDPMDGLNMKLTTIPEALIIGAINSRNSELLDLSLKLLPLKLTYPKLAFNIACVFAKKKDKENMLDYVNQALKLNKTKKEFLADEDFKSYLSDPDFKKIIGN